MHPSMKTLLNSFSSGDKLFAFIRGFYGLKGLPNSFPNQMSSFFETLIEQGFALVYIDDILLLADSKRTHVPTYRTSPHYKYKKQS